MGINYKAAGTPRQTLVVATSRQQFRDQLVDLRLVVLDCNQNFALALERQAISL